MFDFNSSSNPTDSRINSALETYFPSRLTASLSQFRQYPLPRQASPSLWFNEQLQKPSLWLLSRHPFQLRIRPSQPSSLGDNLDYDGPDSPVDDLSSRLIVLASNHQEAPLEHVTWGSSHSRALLVKLRNDYVMHFNPSNPDVCLVETSNPVDESITFDQAIMDLAWLAAMKDEYDSLLLNQTWDLVSLPPGKKVIFARQIYRLKHELNPVRLFLKAHLVARGLEQRYGIDFEDTFAPIIKWSTLHLIIALAASLG
ncbi:unnamed protein product [Calypogeia fissa]